MRIGFFILVSVGFFLQAVSPAVQAAELRIVSPVPGHVVYQQEALQARAQWTGGSPGMEQRQLTYRWSSDSDGPVGSGLETTIGHLSYRPHLLRIEALSGDTLVAEAAVTVTVIVSPVQWSLSERNDWQGEFSPRGTMVTFTSSRSGDPEIWLSNSVGRDVRRITNKGGWGASWSADGNRLVFWSDRGGSRDIWQVMDLDEEILLAEPVAFKPCQEWAPACSPVDNRVAYVVKQGKRLSIKLVDTDDPETLPVEVVGPDYQPMFPRWLPDAAGLLFTSFAGSVPAICRVLFDNGTVEQVSGDSGGAEDADISPDGGLIVMVREKNLWLHRVNDRLEWPVTRGETGAMAPRFSPDGRRVLYASMRSGNYDLWLLDVPGDL